MPIISTVGLYCCDKFEETPNEKVVNMSKVTKFYFNTHNQNSLPIFFGILFGGTAFCVLNLELSEKKRQDRVGLSDLINH